MLREVSSDHKTVQSQNKQPQQQQTTTTGAASHSYFYGNTPPSTPPPGIKQSSNTNTSQFLSHGSPTPSNLSGTHSIPTSRRPSYANIHPPSSPNQQQMTNSRGPVAPPSTGGSSFLQPSSTSSFIQPSRTQTSTSISGLPKSSKVDLRYEMERNLVVDIAPGKNQNQHQHQNQHYSPEDLSFEFDFDKEKELADEKDKDKDGRRESIQSGVLVGREPTTATPGYSSFRKQTKTNTQQSKDLPPPTPQSQSAFLPSPSSTASTTRPPPMPLPTASTSVFSNHHRQQPGLGQGQGQGQQRESESQHQSRDSRDSRPTGLTHTHTYSQSQQQQQHPYSQQPQPQPPTANSAFSRPSKSHQQQQQQQQAQNQTQARPSPSGSAQMIRASTGDAILMHSGGRDRDRDGRMGPPGMGMGNSGGVGGGVGVDLDRDFERLLDELQLPPSVRSKLSQVDTPIKQSFLTSSIKASQSLGGGVGLGQGQRPTTSFIPPGGGAGSRTASPLHSHSPLPLPPHGGETPKSKELRKTKSGSHLNSPSSPSNGWDRDQVGQRNGNDGTPTKDGSPYSVRTVENSRFVMITSTTRPQQQHHQSYPATTSHGLPMPPPDLPIPGASKHKGNESKKAETKEEKRKRGQSFSAAVSSFLPASVGRGMGVKMGLGNSSGGVSEKDGSSIGSSNDGKRRSYLKGSANSHSSASHSSNRGSYYDNISSSYSGGGVGGAGGVSGSGHSKHSPQDFLTFLLPNQQKQLPRQNGSSKHSSLPGNNSSNDGEFARSLDLAKIKKLRMVLRHETLDWIGAWVSGGGYVGLGRVLGEVLAMEWREEQHDDQLLYELLRCIKALFTSEAGRQAIRASAPFPFKPLSVLLFSEKKPGDISSRQLIVELWIELLASWPSPCMAEPELAGVAGRDGSPARPGFTGSRPSSIRFDDGLGGRGSQTQIPTLAALATPIPDGHKNINGFVKSLLIPPTDPSPTHSRGNSQILPPASELPAPKLDMHDFLTVAHRPRVMKPYITEISDVCRDYFWIFCHGENGLWSLAELDVRLVDKPRAPTGATGSVEFESIDYATTHFRLINALAASFAEGDLLNPALAEGGRGEAWQLHSELMLAGMDRVLCTVRKASVDFYPHFHLELARYIKHAQDASFDLPYVVKKLVISPPEKIRKREGTLAVAERHARENAGKGGRGQQWIPKSETVGNFDFQT